MAIGRYAPSPTGIFHLGNLRTALAAWLFARSTGSDFRLRWEDLDVVASTGHEERQRGDLGRLGIDFDGSEVRQSERKEFYRDALSSLIAAGLTYPCWCSRREVREAAAAPHGSPSVYPGTCRHLDAAAIAEHHASGRQPAVRLRAHDTVVTITDRLRGVSTEAVDDFVLARGDGTPAYNLVVVLDDAAQNVEEVVRGDDLLASTFRQAHLQHVLGLASPIWSHVPLVLDHAGERLAKRDGSAGLDRWVAGGGTVATLLGSFGKTLGIDIGPTATIQELLAGFDISQVPLEPVVVGRHGAELSLLS